MQCFFATDFTDLNDFKNIATNCTNFRELNL